jgi:uncharacterized protein YndB with AHSA1/START domain
MKFRALRRRSWRLVWGALAVLAVCALPASAELKSVSASTFQLSAIRSTAASPQQAFAALSQKLPAWWHPEHTWSGAAKNLSLKARAGGCFCETLPGGGSVEHARVVFVKPPEVLRLEGGLGPLQNLGVVGVLTFNVAPAANGSTITLTYTVSGNLPAEPQGLATAVDQVLTQQLERLARYIDTGSPTP